jgi:MFS transporter, putative metabolite:H+ symporter
VSCKLFLLFWNNPKFDNQHFDNLLPSTNNLLLLKKCYMQNKRVIYTTVIVAALGYMVDIYDLIIFSIVRVKSLKDIGVATEQLQAVGLDIMGKQMLGMLIGGLLWGILGDKLGRLSVLFGSILLYSVANAANGFVADVETYKWLRFIAGIGLAGELGAGITLVSEVMSKEQRGIGTTIVASVGVAGAILAYFINELFDWRNAFIFGGGLGFLLLILRISVFESGMFNKIKHEHVERGNFLRLFTNKKLFFKYLKCIGIGLPTWFVIGILAFSAPEYGKAFGMSIPPQGAGQAIMWAYVGLVAGDIASGILSQVLKSRKKALLIFIAISCASVAFYLSSGNISLPMLNFKCFLLGCGMGYWAMFVTNASEQFGTNLRSTVTTTVPNVVRGLLDPMQLLFRAMIPSIGIIQAGWLLAAITMSVAILAVIKSQETFGKDLDYLEYY